MTTRIYHTFTSPKSDGSDNTLVQPSSWNADHSFIIDLADSASLTNILPLSKGGSNNNLTAVNGGLVYSDASKMVITAAIGANKLVATDGSGIPTGTLTLPNGVIRSYTNSISAAGTTQGTATSLTSDANFVTTVAANTGVLLPTGSLNREVFVYNLGANPLKIYPDSGAGIDALGTNAAFTLPAGYIASFTYAATNVWKSSANYAVNASSVTGTLAVANGGTGVTTSTGSGNVVLSTSPTLTTPVISSIVNTGTLTLPTSTDTLVGKATTDIFTNKTFNTAGTGNVFQINGTSITAVTGSGSVVLATTPTLTTPVLGVATATSINKVAFTAPATGSTLTIADGKTLTASNSITLAGTDATTMTFPSTSQSIAGLGVAQTWTAAQTLRAANALRVEAAATQDAVILAGRAGGTGSFGVTISPTTLTSSRTVTLADGNTVLSAGTMAVTGTGLNQFAATTSLQLAGVISDETGSGSLVFGTSPTITTSLITDSTSFDLINTTATTINFGSAATVGLNIGSTTGTITLKGTTIALPNAGTVGNGKVLTSDASGNATWQPAPVSLPTQTGNNGKYLTTDGSTASWATITAGDPVAQMYAIIGL